MTHNPNQTAGGAGAVEAAARALFEHDERTSAVRMNAPWESLREYKRDWYMQHALVALSALSPTPVTADIDEAVASDYADYDAGLLNDWGGGNVDWWQDYLRAEIGRANEFWRTQLDEHATPAEALSRLNHECAAERERARVANERHATEQAFAAAARAATERAEARALTAEAALAKAVEALRMSRVSLSFASRIPSVSAEFDFSEVLAAIEAAIRARANGESHD